MSFYYVKQLLLFFVHQSALKRCFIFHCDGERESWLKAFATLVLSQEVILYEGHVRVPLNRIPKIFPRGLPSGTEGAFVPMGGFFQGPRLKWKQLTYRVGNLGENKQQG